MFNLQQQRRVSLIIIIMKCILKKSMSDTCETQAITRQKSQLALAIKVLKAEGYRLVDLILIKVILEDLSKYLATGGKDKSCGIKNRSLVRFVGSFSSSSLQLINIKLSDDHSSYSANSSYLDLTVASNNLTDHKVGIHSAVHTSKPIKLGWLRL